MEKKIKSCAVLCVYKDKKSNIYTAPMLFDNEECALRHFDNLSLRDINICDYDLYLLGFYNNQFAEIELLQNNDKYLLRSGDYYWDYISKVKDLSNKTLEIKELYRKQNDDIKKYAFELYKIINKDKTYEDFEKEMTKSFTYEHEVGENNG